MRLKTLERTNKQNQHMRQYQGAYWHKTSEKWMAIMKDRKGRLVYIGGYPTKKQASIAHDAVAKYVAAHKRN